MKNHFIRALRLPFIAASVLPFIFGSLLAGHNFKALNFILGLVIAACVHLSANLINDYADSKSGVDWRDLRFYGFFGGSKLIQENIFSQNFYLFFSLFFMLVSFLCVIALSFILKNIAIIGFYTLILLLAWGYSLRPVQFSYRMLGEFIIFLLFGPALVMGAYFVQTGIFPTREGFLLSLPFGFFTTAILFANEIPDFSDDKSAGKITWVNLFGAGRSFALYYLLICLGFLSIFLNIALGYSGWIAAVAFIFIVPAFRAAKILKQHYDDKIKLIDSARLTIMVQTFVSIVLILDVLI